MGKTDFSFGANHIFQSQERRRQGGLAGKPRETDKEHLALMNPSVTKAAPSSAGEGLSQAEQINRATE